MADGPLVDGVVSSSPEPSAQKPKPAASKPPKEVPDKAVKTWKLTLSVAAGFFYLLFIIWCGFLLSILPSQQDLSTLVLTGIFSMLLAAAVFLGVGALAFSHIAKSKADPRARMVALIKLGLLVVPGVIIAALTAFMITREPSFTIDIVKPETSEELVAPVSISFSVENAVSVLAERNFRPLQYGWDINGDKEIDQETLEPVLTATFEREGIYAVTVLMTASDGTKKTASRRFVIREAVFSVAPSPPILDQPVVFSLSHLYPQPNTVAMVQWDFDGDGQVDEEGASLQSTYTYLRTGKFTVIAQLQLTNNTQARYERVIDVQEPPELPFPVSIETTPTNLIGTAPFGASFSIVTNEPINTVQWNFGDGQRGDGERVTHTFTQNGNYAVTARVRSQSGVIADISKVVKVVDRLNLNDLRYEGTPEVQGNKITGEVPLTIDLQPTTQKPFVEFSWEAPEATEVGSTEGRLQAIYRRAGTYTVTLVAQDDQNHVLRQPITIEVRPASSLISISMDPETGVAPLMVKFDASESTIPGEDITGFIWNFGDNSPQEFGGASTQHIYQNPGTYVINLTARTSSGKQQSTSKTLIVRAPILQARPLASRLSGTAPLTVAFDGTPSTGPIASYLWNFGDGSENDSVKTEHTFLEPGQYPVQLTVTDVNGKTATSTITINVN